MEPLRAAPAARAALAILLVLGSVLGPVSAAPAAGRRAGGSHTLLPAEAGRHGRPAQQARPNDAVRAATSTPPWLQRTHRVAAGAVVVVAAVLLVLGGVLVRRRRPREVPEARIPIRPAAPPPERPRALGYVRLAPGAPSSSFHAQAAAIETGCLARGLRLVSLVSDADTDPSGPTAPALAYALERLAAGDVERLVVSRLEHLARTRDELSGVLETLAAHRIGLVVLDRDVDTAALADPVAPGEVLRRQRRFPAGRPAPTARTGHERPDPVPREGSGPEDLAAALSAEPGPARDGGAWRPGSFAAAVRRRSFRWSAGEDRFDA